MPLSKLTRPDHYTTKNENCNFHDPSFPHVPLSSPQVVITCHAKCNCSQKVGSDTSNGSKTSTSLSDDLVSSTSEGGVGRGCCVPRSGSVGRYGLGSCRWVD